VITAQKIFNQKPVALVVGGGDFLGSFLCEALLLEGCRVVCLDNLTKEKSKNLERCFRNKDFIFLNYDFKNLLLPQVKSEEIFYIFDLIAEKNLSFQLWQLAEEKKAKILIVARENFPWDIFSKKFPKVDFRVVYLTNVYGPRMEVKSPQELKEKIYLTPHIFVSDAVFGIVKAMFAGGTKGNIFYLGPQKEEKLKWEPKVNLEEGLRQTLAFLQPSQFSEKKKKPKSSLRKIKKIAIPFLIFLLIFTFLISLPFLEFFLGGKKIKKAAELFLAADFQEAEKVSKEAENFLEKSEKTFSFLGLNKFFARPLFLGKHLAGGIKEGSITARNFDFLLDFIFQNQQADVDELLSETRIALGQVYSHLSFIEGELKNSNLINQTKNFLGFGDLFNKLNKEIFKQKPLIIQIERGMEILPWAIGEGEKRTYLVLLQNSAELRPTGGFIGSFAFLTFEKGKFVDFEVQDVYWADGQLKGYVEPPPELKKYLGEASWYLRDANWDPDFPTSAKKIQWFLEKETGRKVDGVVGINLFVARRLLEVVGEIELSDYKEKINASNFFERAQYHSEIGFFPGSTQKQDFLGAVARMLFEKIRNAKAKTKLEIGKSIYQSLQAKDILVYLNNPQAMEVVFDLGWDGGIRNVNCSAFTSASAGRQIGGDKCLTDYLFVVETNVGVNKANYFVERILNEEIKVEKDGRIRKSLKISYQNKSPSPHFPAGDYKNYLRILVPQGSQLEKVLDGFKEVEKEKIDIIRLSNKTSFGFLVNVPVGEKKEVEINWILPEKIEFGSKFQYLYFVQKQSGMKEEKFNLKILPPQGVVVFPVWPLAMVKDNTYVFTPDFSSDLLFEIYFIGE